MNNIDLVLEAVANAWWTTLHGGKGGGGGGGLGICGGEFWVIWTDGSTEVGEEEDGKVDVVRLGFTSFWVGVKCGEVGLGLGLEVWSRFSTGFNMGSPEAGWLIGEV